MARHSRSLHDGGVARDWPPARSGQTIYEFVRSNLGPDGTLSPLGQALPDERVTEGELKFAPGLPDEIFGSEDSAELLRGRVERMSKQILKVIRSSGARGRRVLYETIVEAYTIGVVDPLIESLQSSRADPRAIQRVGDWLIRTGVNREPVKIGIALLGMTDLGDNLEQVQVLAHHDEFTLFVAVAIKRQIPHPDEILWEIAKTVHGWGRIQVVRRFSDSPSREIREWMLRDGYKNEISNRLLALIVARAGRLEEALRRSSVDRELLTSSAEIITALVGDDRDEEELSGYIEGADAIEAFLILMDARAEVLEDLIAVCGVLRFLSQDADWEARSHLGWTASRREAFEIQCERIIARPAWGDRITVALLSDDTQEFNRGTWAASVAGIDTFDAFLTKIRHEPLEGHWYHAWKQADAERAGILVEMARELVPLTEVATGASNSLGIGDEWKPHNALGWSLQGLTGFPGLGGDLIMAGLQSPVTRNRNGSVRALKAWPTYLWPSGSIDALRSMAEADPNLRARENAREVLSSSIDE